MFWSKHLSNSTRNMWSIPALVLRTVIRPWRISGWLIPGTSTCWGPAWKWLCRDGCWGRTRWTWVSNASSQQKSPTALGKAFADRSGWKILSLHSVLVRQIWNAVSKFWLPSKRKTAAYWSQSSNGSELIKGLQ